MKRHAFFWVTLGLLSACSREPKTSVQKTESKEGATCPSPVLEDSSLAFVQVDSTQYSLGDYDSAYKCTGSDSLWLADFTWFYLPRRPVELKTFAEMSALEEAGQIDTSTTVSFIAYRMRLQAPDYTTLLARAKKLRPRTPPAVLTAQVEAFLTQEEAKK